MFVLKVPEFTHTNERLILTIFGLQLSGPSFDQFVDLLRGVPKRDSGRGTNVKYRRQPCISAFASMPEAALPRALNQRRVFSCATTEDIPQVFWVWEKAVALLRYHLSPHSSNAIWIGLLA